MTYSPNIPTGTVPLNSDYITIRTNFQELDSIYGTDHQAYSVTTTDATHHSGYHKIVHLLNQAADPADSPDYGALYTKTVTNNELFYKSTGNIVTQLTTNSSTTTGTSGSVPLFGGLILKWGVTATVASGTNLDVSFPTAFPTNCYSVVLTPVLDVAGNTTAFLLRKFQKDKFTVRNSNNNTNGYPFQYIAIGN